MAAKAMVKWSGRALGVFLHRLKQNLIEVDVVIWLASCVRRPAEWKLITGKWER